MGRARIEGGIVAALDPVVRQNRMWPSASSAEGVRTSLPSAREVRTWPSASSAEGVRTSLPSAHTYLGPKSVHDGLVPAPVAERRVCSVVFCDLVGFTELSESRDPEEVRELLSRCFATASAIVGRYGGVIEKFIGDAVMAV